MINLPIHKEKQGALTESDKVILRWSMTLTIACCPENTGNTLVPSPGDKTLHMLRLTSEEELNI